MNGTCEGKMSKRQKGGQLSTFGEDLRHIRYKKPGTVPGTKSMAEKLAYYGDEVKVPPPPPPVLFMPERV